MPLLVARTSALVTSGGVIAIPQIVSLIPNNPLVGLRLDSGYGGTIRFGGAIGSPSLSLGWVELNGGLSNPNGYGVYYPGGSLFPTSERLHNWRNGQGL